MRKLMIGAFVIASGLTAVGFLVRKTTTGQPERIFLLRCQDDDFVVPAGEMWRLSWRSPYKPGEIHPIYDIRVVDGQVRLGAPGAIWAEAYDIRPRKMGLLDLQAASSNATAQLDSGTRFALANDSVVVRVEAFTQSGATGAQTERKASDRDCPTPERNLRR
jgi:hypothetical protein